MAERDQHFNADEAEVAITDTDSEAAHGGEAGSPGPEDVGMMGRNMATPDEDVDGAADESGASAGAGAGGSGT